MGFFYSLQNIKKQRDGKRKDEDLGQGVVTYLQGTKQWHGARERVKKIIAL